MGAFGAMGTRESGSFYIDDTNPLPVNSFYYLYKSLSLKCCFCLQSIIRRFPRKCHGCSQSIAPNELIMRARHLVYHLGCFKCLICDRQLNTGDEFGLGKDALIYCRLHYYYHLQQQQHLHIDDSSFNFKGIIYSPICVYP